MVYVEIAVLIISAEMLVYHGFIRFRDKGYAVSGAGHFLYDARRLTDVNKRVRLLKDQFVSLKIIPEHLQHLRQGVRAAAAAPICKPYGSGESHKIKHFELLPSFARSPPKACPYHRETAAGCTGGLPSLVSPYFPYYLDLFLDLLLDL